MNATTSTSGRNNQKALFFSKSQIRQKTKIITKNFTGTSAVMMDVTITLSSVHKLLLITQTIGKTTARTASIFSRSLKAVLKLSVYVLASDIYFLNCFGRTRLTVCVTCWWAGRDNVILSESTSSPANCLKTRRLPPVKCTLCWALEELKT